MQKRGVARPQKGGPRPPPKPPAEPREEQKAPRSQSLERPSGELDALRQRYTALLQTINDEHNETERLAARIRQLKVENRRLRQEEQRRGPEDDLRFAMQISSLDNDDSTDPELQLALQESASEFERPMSYEELLAISESIGNVPTGLKPDEMARLPRARVAVRGETCTICMVEVALGEEVIRLPRCKHVYHSACISTWLEQKKTCPMCLAEVL